MGYPHRSPYRAGRNGSGKPQPDGILHHNQMLRLRLNEKVFQPFRRMGGVQRHVYPAAQQYGKDSGDAFRCICRKQCDHIAAFHPILLHISGIAVYQTG